MRVAIIGFRDAVTERLKEMKAMSDKGGGVIYEGARADDNTVCVIKKIIPASGRVEDIEVQNLDPAPSQSVYNHASSFEWGYGGSGPAQLALALLLDATGDKVIALKYHQGFKERFVAGWKSRWSIHARQVRAWVEMKKLSDETQEYLRGLESHE